MPFIRLRRYAVYRLEPGHPFQVPGLGEGFTAKPFEKDDLRYFKEDPSQQQTFQGFLAKGREGVLVLHGGAWAAYAWLTHPPTSGRPWQMPALVDGMDVFWFFSAHTRDIHRGRGLVKFMHGWRIQRALQAPGGPRAIYIDAAPGNTPARKGMLSAGFQPCGVMHCLHLTLRHVGGRTFGRWHEDEPHPPLQEGRHA